jgi:hypothetical protein
VAFGDDSAAYGEALYDAVVMGFWPRFPGYSDAYGVVRCEHCDEPYLRSVHPQRWPHCRTPHTEPVSA